MQSLSYQQDSYRASESVKRENQFSLPRRAVRQHQKIFAAVRAWESTIPGRAQQQIAMLVAEKWQLIGGRGVTVNKQNLYRYLKNEGGSEKYTRYVLLLAPAIAEAMPIEIARAYGLKNGLTEQELVASALKECAEAQQAKLTGAPVQRLEKEVREGMEALLRLMPPDNWNGVLTSLTAMLGGCL
ncbi:hypothetical protein TUM12370_24740 [Salmonella enterica subsp. enterica serovar Choleraesuis]|nr:hypothetical protein TUM12370_24740 [Salmonella enterica subsp. enterica serovar Choleraesuis]